ncbi:MAG: polysaccharide pyruvyl transferase family protein [Bacteroidales bacterium]|nr:polysaccharide pyruvyl transferase family protein [Bacteroidales bacterium]
MNSFDHRLLLQSALQKLITNDYVLLDLPYYSNVGDVLIWEATLQLLKKVKHCCLYSCSVDTYRKPHIGQEVILLFSGGGNFGDLWEKHQPFRHRVMEDFPNNPIVQLPQSVWFEDEENLKKDIQYYKNHGANVTICTRDQQSYDIIQRNYSNVQPLLLPDLVLALDIDTVLRRNRLTKLMGEGTLYFKRDDKEFAGNNLDIHYDKEGDWPCMNYDIKWVRKYNDLMLRLERMNIPKRIQLKITDLYYRYIIKDAYLRNGIRFLMPYREVYATRLHAAILAWLLGKKVYMIDNTYHKCSGVYDLWMKDLENISLV